MKITFISTMNNDPWGGSEFLWSGTALRLVQAGHSVSASVPGWPRRVPQAAALMAAGIKIQERPLTMDQHPARSLKRLAAQLLDPFLRPAFRQRFANWLKQSRPDLICISNGSYADNLPLLELVRRSGFPYVMLGHANAEQFWPDDRRAQTVLELFRGARRGYFVSEGNRRLLATQLGTELANAEVVRNPFNVPRDAAPPWPAAEPVLLACVGRLDPDAKGQDLLLQVLARDVWRSRPVKVSFYGRGRSEQGLRRLTERLRLQDTVRFAGHTDSIENIWATHHALVLPSRYEGLPLAIVEAMHCGRPSIVTDVAGNAELLQDGVTGYVAEAATEEHLHRAMERAWQKRADWPQVGAAAARSVRAQVPADPIAVFTQKLLDIARQHPASDACHR